jgi:hypothetical protein
MRAAALALLLLPSLALAQSRSARDGVEPEPRYLAPLSYGVRLGGLLAYAAPRSGASAVGMSAYGLFDQQALLADVSVDALGGEKSLLLAGGLGVYGALQPAANTSPYLGGGARLAWARFGGDGAFGLQLFGAVGLLASRRWSPHVRLELAWFFDTMGERSGPGGAKFYANGPMATIGLGF